MRHALSVLLYPWTSSIRSVTMDQIPRTVTSSALFCLANCTLSRRAAFSSFSPSTSSCRGIGRGAGLTRTATLVIWSRWRLHIVCHNACALLSSSSIIFGGLHGDCLRGLSRLRF
ncbi:hypothetical protein HDK64DRAFT_282238 [Phyllosticta capitalensis]